MHQYGVLNVLTILLLDIPSRLHQGVTWTALRAGYCVCPRSENYGTGRLFCAYASRVEDVVVLLKLAGEPQEWTLRSLEGEIAIPRSVIHPLDRPFFGSAAGLLDAAHHRVDGGVRPRVPYTCRPRYVFPPVLGGEKRVVSQQRGPPPALPPDTPQPADLPQVWPVRWVRSRGIALEPFARRRLRGLHGATRSSPSALHSSIGVCGSGTRVSRGRAAKVILLRAPHCVNKTTIHEQAFSGFVQLRADGRCGCRQGAARSIDWSLPKQ